MNTEQERAEFRALVESLSMDQQERADFEAWHAEKYWAPLFDDELGRFIPTVVQNRWEAYQAGRAALQSQDREDAERLDWLEADANERTIKLGKCWYVRDGFGKTVRKVSSLREAIDHARRVEGES